MMVLTGDVLVDVALCGVFLVLDQNTWIDHWVMPDMWTSEAPQQDTAGRILGTTVLGMDGKTYTAMDAYCLWLDQANGVLYTLVRDVRGTLRVGDRVSP